MSTFSEHGSLRMTSGAIHATVPANDIFVLFSFHSRHVPKSEIFMTSFLDINTLKQTSQYIIIYPYEHVAKLLFFHCDYQIKNSWERKLNPPPSIPNDMPQFSR